MDTVTVDVRDLFRILRLASRSEYRLSPEDIRAYSKICQALLALGMDPNEIGQRIHQPTEEGS